MIPLDELCAAELELSDALENARDNRLTGERRVCVEAPAPIPRRLGDASGPTIDTARARRCGLPPLSDTPGTGDDGSLLVCPDDGVLMPSLSLPIPRPLPDRKLDPTFDEEEGNASSSPSSRMLNDRKPGLVCIDRFEAERRRLISSA